MKKYMRIQGHEYSYQTRKPTGLFALCHRRVNSGVFSDEDINLFYKTDKWFKENLIQPQFYLEGNTAHAITWFKTSTFDRYREKTGILTGLLDKYNVPYDIIYTDFPGTVIYEDDYQIGAADPWEYDAMKGFGA